MSETTALTIRFVERLIISGLALILIRQLWRLRGFDGEASNILRRTQSSFAISIALACLVYVVTPWLNPDTVVVLKAVLIGALAVCSRNLTVFTRRTAAALLAESAKQEAKRKESRDDAGGGG